MIGKPNTSAAQNTILCSAGILIKDQKILLAQRAFNGKPYEGFWEFPGGKIEVDESPEEALKRELKEELNIHTHQDHFHLLTKLEDTISGCPIKLYFYMCEQWENTPELLVHEKLEWVTSQNIERYNLIPLNFQILPLLCQRL